LLLAGLSAPGNSSDTRSLAHPEITDHESAPPAFYDEVLPIIQRRCQDCHRPGEVAPFPLLTYEDVTSEAHGIRRMVQTRRMPPWSAEPGVGVPLHNDRSLSETEIATIVEWIDGGMPEGAGDVGSALKDFPDGWQIEPDMIVEVPPFPVPAEGTVEYTYYIVPEVFTEDRWVKVTELRPANREVTHHLIAYVRPPGSSYFADYPVGEFFVPEPGGRTKPAEESAFQWRRMLGGYAPGSNPGESNFSDDQAVFLEAGSQLVFELHYTAKGEATTDSPRLGIQFFDGEPASRRLGSTVINTRFEIPPHADNHRVDAGTRMMRDVELLSLTPHMHLRGKSWEFRAIFPDGTTKVLVNVPEYDFMWQSTYYLAEPLHLPAGTVIEGIAHFDNSKGNRHNPDPDSPVTWGDQSWEEMMVGFFDVAVPSDVDPETVFGRR
jgi:hypothetical protein